MLSRIKNAEAFNGESGFVATASDSRQYGWSMAAGDLDGDNKAELVVGIPYVVSPQAFGDFGIVWGGSYKFPPTFIHKAFVADNCKGVNLKGALDDRALAFTMAIGNVNGGVAANLLVSTRSYRLYIFNSGSRSIFSNFLFNQLDDFSAQHGSIITGLPLVYTLKLADLNNDGVNEIFIVNSVNGTVDVIMGRPEGFPPVSSFNEMTSAQKFRLVGAPKSNFASSVAVTDLNHDGFKDILVAANQDNNLTGVVHGFLTPANGKFVDRNTTTSEYRIVVGQNDIMHKSLVSGGMGVGDITNDGIDEITLCGGYGGTEFSDRYVSYCVTLIGKKEFVPQVNISTVKAPDAFFSQLGAQEITDPYCVGKNGGIGVIDINGDGYKDLYIANSCMEHHPATPLYVPSNNNGSVAFIFGRNITETPFSSSYNRSDLIGNEGYDWKGSQYSSFGYQSVVADFDGDGMSDIAVSAPYAPVLGGTESVFVALSGTNKTDLMPTCEPPPSPTLPSFYPSEWPVSSAGRNVPLPHVMLESGLNMLTSKPVLIAATTVATRSAVEVIDYASQAHDWSRLTKYAAQGAAYCLGAYGAYRINYSHHYNKMSASAIPEADKERSAHYQALADTAGLIVTYAAATACEKLEKNGWSRTGKVLSWVGSFVGVSSCMYSVYQGNVGTVLAAAAVGAGVKRVVTGAGAKEALTGIKEELNDNVAIPRNVYKTPSMLFSSSKPASNAHTPEMRVAANHR